MLAGGPHARRGRLEHADSGSRPPSTFGGQVALLAWARRESTGRSVEAGAAATTGRNKVAVSWPRAPSSADRSKHHGDERDPSW